MSESPSAARTPASPRLAAAWALVVLALAAVLAWWVERGRPVPLPEPASASWPCLSYAPFRRAGHNPFDANLIVSPAQIEADLRILRERTRCVRTYGVGHGLAALPAIAQRLGLRVRLGAWLGRDEKANALELERAVALAREFAGTVELLIVGSEVLLRRELSPEALAAWLERARRQVSVPVSYADVWEFWLRHAGLQEHVDVVTIHVLPYWEDEPVAVGDAVAHVYAIAGKVRARFPQRPLWVGETGWPAAGRQRAAAAPGRVEQARFMREIAVRAQREPLDFNLIEAFDQPWKRALEGTAGGYWGVHDAQGEPRFAPHGSVQADPHWQRGPLAALCGGALGALLGGVLGFRQGFMRRFGAGARLSGWPLAAHAALALGLPGALLAALCMAQWQMMSMALRSPVQWLVDGLGTLTLGAFAAACGWRLAARLRANAEDGVAWPGVAAAIIGGGLHDLHGQHERHGRHGRDGQRLFAVLCAAALFVAGALALPLVFDARYRELPWPLLVASAVLIWALRLSGDRLAAGAREERVLAAVLLACALAIGIQEGPANAQAALLALGMAGFALAVLWPHGAARGRTHTSSASNTAGAAKPAE